MRGIVGLLPGGEVAAGSTAIGGRDLQVVVVVEVAGGASDVGMTVGERKASGAVIEAGCGPTNGGVAGGAVCDGERGACLRVCGAAGLLPGRKVATGIATVRGRDLQMVVVIEVARGAGNVGVAIGEQKSGGAVIEAGAEKRIKTVAPLAIRGSERGTGVGVIGIGGVLPVLQMAGIALRGEAEELADSRARVAGIARHRGVRSEKRKAVLVILYLLRGDVP